MTEEEFCKVKFQLDPESPSWLNEHYVCTPNHKLLLEGVGWTNVADLKVGDKIIMASQTHEVVTIARIERFLYKPPINELAKKFAIALMIADDFLKFKFKSYELGDPPVPLDVVRDAVAEAKKFLGD